MFGRYRTLTGNIRFRSGLFGRRILQVEITKTVDDLFGGWWSGTESCRLTEWSDASKSDRLFISHICQHDLKSVLIS